jgi:hypothetical protein
MAGRQVERARVGMRFGAVYTPVTSQNYLANTCAMSCDISAQIFNGLGTESDNLDGPDTENTY